MNIKDSKTWENLKAAVQEEAMAYLKYTYYASKARKDGYEQLAGMYDEITHNEKEHGEIWFKLLHDGSMPSSIDNLKDSIQVEDYETKDFYRGFAQTAREEGFDDIAKLFDGVADVEGEHEEIFKKFLSNIEEQEVFKKDEAIVWQCRNCGHVETGTAAPTSCPVCSHPQAFFQMKENNY